jgi:hypothetical protein
VVDDAVEAFPTRDVPLLTADTADVAIIDDLVNAQAPT